MGHPNLGKILIVENVCSDFWSTCLFIENSKPAPGNGDQFPRIRGLKKVLQLIFALQIKPTASQNIRFPYITRSQLGGKKAS